MRCKAFPFFLPSERCELKYTLLMPTGRVMCFYVKEVADLYQRINGGVVITQQVLETLDNSQETSIMESY
jgi:hypothetical protein